MAEYKMNWGDHTSRMNEARLPKLALQIIPDGVTKCGTAKEEMISEAGKGMNASCVSIHVKQ
jgi:hypothetical protein